MVTGHGYLRDPWRFGRVVVMRNQIHVDIRSVADRTASEAVGGGVESSVDNGFGTASSRFGVGPNGKNPAASDATSRHCDVTWPARGSFSLII
jgi:hypothetical protein